MNENEVIPIGMAAIFTASLLLAFALKWKHGMFMNEPFSDSIVFATATVVLGLVVLAVVVVIAQGEYLIFRKILEALP